MRDKIWIFTLILAILLLVLTFTPLVIPYHIYKPTISGVPYSLWMSFLVTVIMLLNIMLATRFHPGEKD